jgi:RNA polymerase sigma factor (sigma-70 family)
MKRSRSSSKMTRPILLPLPNPPSDAELVARAISSRSQGDRFGRELIYRRHAAYLLAMVTRLVSTREGAEAIVRETFVVAWKRLTELTTTEQSADLRLWLSRIAVGLARRRLRRDRLLRLIGLGPDRADHDQDGTLAALAAVDLRHEAREDLEHVDRVLDRAGVEPRLAWMLRRVDGLALDEVASACACSPATAQRRIAEIDARLCDRFGTPAESP